MGDDRKLRLLVTGRNGQVVRALTALGEERQAGLPAVEVFTLARPEFDLAGPTDFSDRFSHFRPDVIVNAAAYTAVDKAESERELAYAVNAAGAGCVAQAAAALAVPVIQLSTDYVFDGTSARPYRELDPIGPINVYGATKLAGEAAVRDASPNHVVLRTSWVYAPFGQNFMLTMLRLGSEREEIRVVDDQHGAPTSAFDIAAAIVTIARHLVDRPADRSLRGIFHFANLGETSWAGFALEIFRQASLRGWPSARVSPITTAQYPTAAKRPASSRLNTSKIEQVFGICPPQWNDALRKTLERLGNLSA